VSSIERMGGVAVAAAADVTDDTATSHAIETLRSALGTIDVLVNNAGINGPIAAFGDADPDAWWRAIEVNLGGTVRCTRLVLPGMLERRRGRIINITSTAGTYRWPALSAYSVSKCAVVKFTENLGVQLRHSGVSIFSLHPGMLEIGMGQTVMNGEARPGSAVVGVRAWKLAQKAAGRVTLPDRAAEYVVTLASGRADALSGRHVSVDDDLDTLLRHAEDIKRQDLHTLRVRTLDCVHAPTGCADHM
jgi:NAD(P)-dependent dehydrogenase (short-subunit alcohol dehydrogenase family)